MRGTGEQGEMSPSMAALGVAETMDGIGMVLGVMSD